MVRAATSSGRTVQTDRFPPQKHRPRFASEVAPFFTILLFSLFGLSSLSAASGAGRIERFPVMSLEARVKSVLSGDTVVLSHVQNPAQERILSLAYVSAPRLRREGDEVCIN